MIVAIEGASAAGKTTWCRQHFPDRHVPEVSENVTAPDLFADPTDVGQFWVKHSIETWQKALALECAHGVAVCDGDPFHLYYSWALWKSGTLTSALFDIEFALYREAFNNQQVGFADYVLWLDVPDEELRRRAQADTTRRRKRHEIYLTLVPRMKVWFRARELVLSGSVHTLVTGLRVEELMLGLDERRYDTQVMDRMLELICRSPAS